MSRQLAGAVDRSALLPRVAFASVAFGVLFASQRVLVGLIGVSGAGADGRANSVSWAGVAWADVGIGLLAAALVATAVIVGARTPGLRAPRPLSHPWRWGFSIFGILTVSSAVFLLAHWPGVGMNDTWTILNTPQGNAYGHPEIYAWALRATVDLGRAPFGGWSAGLAVAGAFQALAFNAVLAWVVVGSAQATGRRWIAGAGTLFLLQPLVANYSVALVKDSLFSVFVAAFSLSCWQLVARRKERPRRWEWFLLVVWGLGMSLTRNNGLAVVLVALLILFVTHRRWWRQFGASILAIGVLSWGLPHLVVNNNKAQAGQVVPISLPIQQIGATFAAGGTIREDDRALFNRVLPERKWGELYDPFNTDPIGWNDAFNGGYLAAHQSEFLAAWARTGQQNPSIYTLAWVRLSQPLWDTNSYRTSFRQSSFTNLISNVAQDPGYQKMLVDKGIQQQDLLMEPAQGLYQRVVSRGLDLPGAGWWLWATLSLLVGALTLRRWRGWPAYLPGALTLGTLLVGSPTNFPFRYCFWYLTCMVVWLAGLVDAPAAES